VSCFGDGRNQHHFAVAGGGKAPGDDQCEAKAGAGQRKEVSLAQQRLLTFV
jgi:hypothetical protein